MKKNFMAIAALLIAAMLLVVSCSQEVAPNAEVDNGLVEAKLSVGYGRDITVDKDTKADDLTVTYKMTPQWVAAGTTTTGGEQITNPANDWTTLEGGNLGWVTPGYWMIEVKASKNNKDVFSGNVFSYFSKNTTSATVYLRPVDTTTKCSISISVTMQDIKDKVNGVETSYKLQYEILSGTGGSVEERKDFSTTAPADYITTYSASKTGLDAGFYTAIVYVVDANNQTVGGIRKGFLLTNGDQAELKGHIEPSDYSNVTINAVYVDVNIGLVAGQQSITDITDEQSTTKKQYQVTVAATDSTTVPSYAGEFSKSYIWYVNGKQDGQEANTLSSSKTFSFDNPGYKNIACQAVYKSNLDDTVYFTETASIYVLVNNINQSAEPTT